MVYGNVALLLLRLILSQIFLVHGARKIVKKEASGAPKYVFLGWLEVIASLLMLTGFMYQIAALAMMVIMVGAVGTKLFVWKDQSYVNNIEYDVLIGIASIVIFFLGPGYYHLG